MFHLRKRFCLTSSNWAIALCLLTAVLLTAFPSPAYCETYYFYDGLERLIKVISDDGIVYEYDEVGNMLSITGLAIKKLPPVLNSISPDILFKNDLTTTVTVTISGENLMTTETVSTDNADISIGNFESTDTSIAATLTIDQTASLGGINIEVVTLYGSAKIPVDIAKLNFEPSQTAVAAGSTVDVSARIERISRDFTVVLDNQNPDIISAPQSITIPANGSTTFAINALKEGTGVIAAGNSGVSVYVTQAFSGNTMALTKPVSVEIKQVKTENYNGITSNAVSIDIQRTDAKTYSPITSNTVSIAIQSSSSMQLSPVVSPSVSVEVGR